MHPNKRIQFRDADDNNTGKYGCPNYIDILSMTQQGGNRNFNNNNKVQ